MNYRFVIDEAAFLAVLEANSRERHILHESFLRIAAAPSQEPDLKEYEAGRELGTRFFGPFSVTYWVDHAVREVRVVLIFRD